MAGPFRLPLIPIFLSYTIGITLGYFDLPFFPQAWILVIIFLCLWMVTMALRRQNGGSWVVLGIFLSLGSASIQAYLHPHHPPSHVSHFNGTGRIAFEGTIDRPPHRTPRGTQLLIRSSDVIVSNRRIPVNGHVLLFVPSRSEPFRFGERYRFLCVLHPPRGFHNPGGFSYERHLAFQRVHAAGFSEEQGWVKLGEGYGNPLLLQVEKWRDQIRRFLEGEATPPSSAILKALVLGEQGDIPEEISEQFTATGIAHLLAISGDHLGIVAFLSFSLLLWILKRSETLLLSVSVKKWAAALTIPCLLLYTLIAGAGISVIRATIMVILFFLSILFQRERNLLHTLVLAAFLILLFSPPSLFDVSFQLSFLAVLSILYLVPRILPLLSREKILVPQETSWRQRLWKYLKLSFLVSGVATLGTAPFVALHFNRISPVGLLTNLFVIPWVGFLIVPVALVASVLSFFLPFMATWLIQVSSVATSVLLQVVSWVASFPFASFFISTPTPVEIVLFYLLLFLTVHLKKGRAVRILFICVFLALVFDGLYWNVKDRFQKDLVLTFIDVGHGDSILVEFPGGKRMLVDGGGLENDQFDIGQHVIAPFLWSKKIRRIDYLVLTHPDPDHLKGLNFVAGHFRVGQFWDNGIRTESEPYWRLHETLAAKKVERLSFNQTSPPRGTEGVQVFFCNPENEGKSSDGERKVSFHNNRSLVMRLQFHQVAILLAGDIEKEAEVRIVRSRDTLKADVLKVPHHGSSSSSTLPFLEKVNPTVAMISVGARAMGRLPHPEVIRRFQDLGCRVYRTDRHGAMTVVTDGEKIKIIPYIADHETGRKE